MTKLHNDYTTAEITPLYDNIDLERVWGLIEKEAQVFVERTPKSAEMYRQSCDSMINGTPSSWWGAWRLTNPISSEYILPHLWYWSHGKNQKAWDVDGNEYIDYMFADTPSIWGHAPDDAFTQGVTDFIKNNGLCTMVPTGDAPIVAELLQKLVDMKYWYVTLSASDSVRSSISIARIITGRRKVLIHNMGYLGLNEEGSYWKPVPGGDVITRWPHYVSGTEDPATKVAEFNDLESVEEALKDGDVALFTTEAMMTDGGFCLAEPGYIQGCYELCQKYGTLFMIDETHTHTHSPRGLYNDMGLTADMWVTGKAIAGGIACGVLGMSEEVGDQYASKLNDIEAPWGMVSLTGTGTTVSANDLSMRALRLSLENYYTDETFGKMVGAMDYLCDGLRDLFIKHDVPFSVTQSGARVHINFNPEPAYNAIDALRGVGLGGYHEYFAVFALNRGFVVMPWSNMLLTSPYTTQEDNDKFLAMFDEFIVSMLG